MTLIVALSVYGLSMLVAGRALAGHFAYAEARRYPSLHRDNGGKPRPGDWAWGAALAFWIAPFWPAVLTAAGVFRVVARFPSLKMGAERRQMLEDRERRVREAEYELGLEPWDGGVRPDRRLVP